MIINGIEDHLRIILGIIIAMDFSLSGQRGVDQNSNGLMLRRTWIAESSPLPHIQDRAK